MPIHAEFGDESNMADRFSPLGFRALAAESLIPPSQIEGQPREPRGAPDRVSSRRTTRPVGRSILLNGKTLLSERPDRVQLDRTVNGQRCRSPDPPVEGR